MTTLLPQDLNDNPIPALRLKNAGAHSIAVSGISARNTTAFDAETRIISIYSDVPVYIAFGDSSINAAISDHYFPANTYYDIAIGGDNIVHYTHMAVLQVSQAGNIYISEKE